MSADMSVDVDIIREMTGVIDASDEEDHDHQTPDS